MGRHTWALSDDWNTCTRCDQKLKHSVCMCCGAGTKGVCWKYPKCKGWAIGTNKGGSIHPKSSDFEFPKMFPDCEHVIAEKKAREAGW